MKSLMKTLKIHVKESIFDDIKNIAGNDNALIEEFLKDNYEIDGTYTIKNDTVDVNKSVKVKNKDLESLTNGLFQFGKVSGYFSCNECKKLTSLKGAPEKVGGYFDCSECPNLVSLEGAPKEVGVSFYCYFCENLESLNGAPKKVGGHFDCYECPKLRSLEGAPKEVGLSFDCSDCSNLKTLKGAPEKVGGVFQCSYCSNLTITDQDRKKYNIED